MVDERALVEALKTGQVRRAGLDVFEREPQVEKELLDDPKVLMSPHYATFTDECSMTLFEVDLTKVASVTDEALENALEYIEKGRPNTPVNEPMPSL